MMLVIDPERLEIGDGLLVKNGGGKSSTMEIPKNAVIIRQRIAIKSLGYLGEMNLKIS